MPASLTVTVAVRLFVSVLEVSLITSVDAKVPDAPVTVSLPAVMVGASLLVVKLKVT